MARRFDVSGGSIGVLVESRLRTPPEWAPSGFRPRRGHFFSSGAVDSRHQGRKQALAALTRAREERAKAIEDLAVFRYRCPTTCLRSATASATSARRSGWTTATASTTPGASTWHEPGRGGAEHLHAGAGADDTHVPRSILAPHAARPLPGGAGVERGGAEVDQASQSEAVWLTSLVVRVRVRVTFWACTLTVVPDESCSTFTPRPPAQGTTVNLGAVVLVLAE